MEGYILLTIIVTVAAVLGIQRLLQSSQTATSLTSAKKAVKRDESFAEITKINDDSAQIGIFDPLTGLPDKQIYDQRLTKTVAHSKTHNHCFSVMILNIDEFENVVNIYGNAFANQLLVKVANRIRPTLRQIDTICRYNNDNFYFIFPELSTTEIAVLVAQRIQDNISQPFIINNHRIFLTASIGITLYNPDEDTPESLVSNAENALVKAKLAGRNTYRIHQHDSYALNKNILDINAKIASSLFLDRLTIRYQPFMDVYNNRSIALATNIYLNDTELGMVPFNDFYTAAEVSGKSLEIMLWQLKTVITQIKKWESLGQTAQHIIIHVPFSQMINSYFIDSARRMFEDENCEKDKVIFDVTETKFSPRHQKFESALNYIEKAGLKLAVSILGIGRLSSQNILNFPIKFVVIDKALLNDLFSSANYEPIITSLVAALNTTDVKILAKGVEYDYQKSKLLKLGCSAMTGKLFSPEVSEEDIILERIVTKDVTEIAE